MKATDMAFSDSFEFARSGLRLAAGKGAHFVISLPGADTRLELVRVEANKSAR
jgi:hypothetical protein